MTTPNKTRPAFKTSAQIYAELDALMVGEKRFSLFSENAPLHKLKPGKNYFKLIAIPDAPLPFVPCKSYYDQSWGTAFITPEQAKRIDIMRIKAAKAGTLKCGKNPNGTFEMNFKSKFLFLAVEIIPSSGRGTGPTVSVPKILALPSSTLKPQVGDLISEFANEKDVNGNFKYRNIFNTGEETPIICIEVTGEGRTTSYTAKVDGVFRMPEIDPASCPDVQGLMEYVDSSRLFGDPIKPEVLDEGKAPVAPDDCPF